MRLASHSVFASLLLITCATMAAPVSEDDAGRDVSVLLFSTHTVHSVTVTPMSDNAWTAHCALCVRHPLTSPLHLTSPAEIFAGGTLRVVDDTTHEQRAATGLWHLRATGHDAEMDIVLTLPSERYVAAVLKAEAAPDEPPQSLRALAILARTYALNGRHFTSRPNHLSADLCDSTQCQAMLLGPVSRAIDEATRASAGETLWFSKHRAEVFFSQNCGGALEDSTAAWPKLQNPTYLRSHPDPYCIRRDRAEWHTQVPLTQLSRIARSENWRLPTNIVAARIVERSRSHRALHIEFIGSDQSKAIISASALHFGVGRTLGWNYIRSDAYDLAIRNGSLIFDGRGHGHGIGLCQTGATQMAKEGKSYKDILAFYFPGTAVRILPLDDGWLETHNGPLTLRTTQPLTPERKILSLQIWEEAQKRFSVHRSITPEITFAPTTEIFRQLTNQPGWILASTQDARVTLQPDSVLSANKRDLSATLLHEMLHILIETESTESTPLWLREGLAEVLANEPVGSINTMPIDAIEKALRHPDSLQLSKRAHYAAATRVHILISRYGPSTVRGWLSSGIPVEAT